MPKITVSRDALHKAILDVKDTAGLDSPKDQHHCTLIVVSGNSVKLSTTDKGRGLRAFSKLQGSDGDTDWRVAIPVVKFCTMLEGFERGTKLQLEANGTNLVVRRFSKVEVQKDVFEDRLQDSYMGILHGLDDPNDPEVPEVYPDEPGPFIKIKRDLFTKLVQTVSEFMADDANTQHNSVSVDKDTIRATNNNVFITCSHSMGKGIPDFAIQSPAILPLLSVLKNQGDDEFEFGLRTEKIGNNDQAMLVFQFASCLFKSKHSANLFTKEPGAVKRNPKATVKTMVIKHQVEEDGNSTSMGGREILRRVLVRLAVAVDETTNIVKFNITKDAMEGETRDPLDNFVKERVVCTMVGSPSTFVLGFNFKYLLMVLKLLDILNPGKDKDLEMLVDDVVFGVHEGDIHVVITRMA